MNGQIVRKHPGGVAAWIKWIKWWLVVMLIGGVMTLPIIVFIQFTESPSVEVIELKKKTSTIESNNYSISELNNAEITLKNYDFLDSIAFNIVGPFSFYGMIFSLLITWQLYLIFKRLELARPFHKEIPRRIQFIGVILIAISAVTLLRVYYMDRVINNLTHQTYKINYKLYAGDMNSFKVGILVLIIAVIYKQGCTLQQEQDLTI